MVAERHGGQGRKGLALWERQAWCAWMPKMGEGSDIHGPGDGRERQGGRAGGDVGGQAHLSPSQSILPCCLTQASLAVAYRVIGLAEALVSLHCALCLWLLEAIPD